MEQTPSQKQPSISLRLDNENKATEFRPLSLSSPHMVAFHLAWLSLFTCFFSTFSIPPLVPIIRRDLHLSDTDIGHAAIASFVGSIFSRLAMGPVCDLLGPRIASASLSLITAPIILSTCFITSPSSFILIRFLVGFCLANFVANQFWMTCMFSGSVVGLANGVAAGWANTGAGVAQLVMPQIYSLIKTCRLTSPSTAWRVSFVIPGIFQAFMAVMVLVYGQDLPSGSCKYKDSEHSKQPKKDNFLGVLFDGLTNYRGWILGLTYGYCFGSELTTDNMIAGYFYDRFGLNVQVAGMIAASFGMANFFTRPMGGVLSDRMGKKFGIRGRLWGLWMVQTMAGILCVILGRVSSLWTSVAVMCLFSVFVQAASGLTFGVVPFVSKRSLGVISGMTGSGGTVGAVVTQLLLFSGSRFSKQTSISLMGLMMIVCTLPVTLIYFPHSGGMFCGPSGDTSSTHEDAEDYHLLV
ncbi:high affinity nitrate transporter 2.7 [Ricinus communis]|uniref:Nitrate transporter, putative n=1 Tax=Ricinus communis TaxID=3988 RepID=B9SF95_RICCO|nr:high affinity nitrate transporter 2.7 [Ricinus communis]EEF37683.1 nitrate transporter, putative [Ricinus communis]|eukprot:XP_002524664.1 high affinity nitrate transporter 2.7 [Ricinus communis]